MTYQLQMHRHKEKKVISICYLLILKLLQQTNELIQILNQIRKMFAVKLKNNRKIPQFCFMKSLAT